MWQDQSCTCTQDLGSAALHATFGNLYKLMPHAPTSMAQTLQNSCTCAPAFGCWQEKVAAGGRHANARGVRRQREQPPPGSDTLTAPGIVCAGAQAASANTVPHRLHPGTGYKMQVALHLVTPAPGEYSMNLMAIPPAMRGMRDGLTKCPCTHKTRHGAAAAHPTGSRRLRRSARQAKEYVACAWSRHKRSARHVRHANARTRLSSPV